MNPAKYLTAGPVASAAKPKRITVKDQEVAQLLERVEDLETCISVNVQLMQDIASERQMRSGEDTETGAHFPSKLYEKLLEQKRLLEAAIVQIRAQKTLCILKIARSEADTSSSQQSEARLHSDIIRQISLARKLIEDKELTIQSLESNLTRLEAELQLCQSSKVAVIDLPGTALRIARLTKTVRQDDQITQGEKLEILDKCKEFHSRNPVLALTDDFGLQLTYENYLLGEKPGDVSEVGAAQSFVTSLMEEAKKEELQMRHVKSKSEINVGGYVQAPEACKVDSATSKFEELLFASKLKTEELASLRKLSSYLDSQKVLLTHKLQQLKSKSIPKGPPSPFYSPEVADF